MKKLFISLLLAVLLNGLTSATPSTCISLVQVSKISKTSVSADYSIKPKKVEFEIHPLDIFSFKFF